MLDAASIGACRDDSHDGSGVGGCPTTPSPSGARPRLETLVRDLELLLEDEAGKWGDLDPMIYPEDASSYEQMATAFRALTNHGQEMGEGCWRREFLARVFHALTTSDSLLLRSRLTAVMAVGVLWIQAREGKA